MFPYWLIFSIFALGALGSEPQQPHRPRSAPLLIVAGLAMMLFVGLRWEVGGDWIPYQSIYDDIGQLTLPEAMEFTEPAYGALNWIAGRLGWGIWSVNLVCAGFFVWGLVRFARQQPNPWLAIVVAIPFLMIVVAMGYTRQGAAIGLAMLALTALRENAIRKCLILVLLASTFHRSSLVLIPVIGLSYTRNRIQALLLTAVASVLAYFVLLDPAIDRYSTGYVEQVYQAEGAGVRLAMLVLPSALTLLFPSRFGLYGAERRMWVNFAVLGLALNILYLLIASNVAIDRLGIYVIPLQMMVFSRLPMVLGIPSDPDRISLLGVIFYSAAVQFVWLTFATNAESWVPYHFLPLIG